MDKLELKALGKINLGLDVLGRRENGYHDVRMVMQTLYLYDNVTLQKKSAPGIEIDSNLFYLPNDEDNIAWKAAKLLIDEFDIKDGIRIHLDKHIPVAAGMAGGSSNAAAVLYGMNQMFRLGLSQKELMEAWGGCSLLHYARNGTRRRNRGKTDAASSDAEMSDSDRQAADQCIDKDGL